MDDSKILIIGASGLLGSELRKLYPKAYCPTSNELDIRISEPHYDYSDYKLIIHCAALNKKQNFELLETNVEGTINLTRLAAKIEAKLVYISTDYVFDGNNCLSKPSDAVKPYNYYGETKLAGEYCVKALPEKQYLILRGSFSPEIWPFDNAYTNHYITKITVTQFAYQIALAIDKQYHGVQHIAGKRQTIWNYANNLVEYEYLNTAQSKKRELKPIKDESVDSYLDFSLQNTIM